MHYVIADPHGEYDRFQRMLERIGFSDGDTLYLLGDAVDRGGIGGVDLLLDVMARPNAVMLLGNHETMCLKAMDHPDDQRAVNHWRRNGGQVTYEALLRLTEAQRQRTLDFLRTLPDCLDLEAGGRRFHLGHAFPAAFGCGPGRRPRAPSRTEGSSSRGTRRCASCGAMTRRPSGGIWRACGTGTCGSTTAGAIWTWTAAAATDCPRAWPACGWRIWRSSIRKRRRFFNAIAPGTCIRRR